MKKTLLTLAFVGALMVSCKEKTEDKIDAAADAVGTEMTQEADTATAKVEAAADTATAKIDKAVETGAAKVEAAAKDAKDAVKK